MIVQVTALAFNYVDVYDVSINLVVEHIQGFVKLEKVQSSAYCLTWLCILDQQWCRNTYYDFIIISIQANVICTLIMYHYLSPFPRKFTYSVFITTFDAPSAVGGDTALCPCPFHFEEVTSKAWNHTIPPNPLIVVEDIRCCKL